ncbi:hypothetical protein N7457_008187 [Penicillium paradoxum]|uniref:uncharacterized protein n=1 Tax=Penicillium paradoxum TaxID=176176 RepID=UPI0025468F23|nr:uncharacterized protein N7457_008187 [Penicillium paradoxum]KAJ5773291.1 hypothetical protein N7457_008187 [Penicillium paradoxum]
MAEVAGLVLGGLPLAIWALEKYAEPFQAFHNYRTSIETFRTDLILQNRQLETTLCNIGLGKKPSSKELRECFDTKFSSISRELMSLFQRMDEVTCSLLKNLDIDTNNKPNALSDRAQWEWHRVKHSFSTKKRKKVIEDLRNWNEDLRRSLEKPEVPAEDESDKVQGLKRRFNVQRCSSIRQCLSSLHRALEAGFRCTCSPPHQAAIDLDWATYESDTAKPFKVAISYGTNPQSSQLLDSWRRVHVTSASSKIASPTPDFLAPSQSPARAPSPSSSIRSKIVHFISRPSPQTPSPPLTAPALLTSSTSASISTSTEITSLCNTACAECTSWTMTGFIKDLDEEEDRQFHLDHSPTNVSKIVKAIPLKTLLSSHEQSTQQPTTHASLSAKQRYSIAASTAWSVLHLSGSPWLTDHWHENQANIFLERNRDGRELLSQHPCASCIFSAPSTPEKPPTTDFDYMIPNRIVFALGILLIELCINKSIAGIQRTSESAMPGSLLDDYQAALRKLDEVYSLAGDSYGYAVERCVKFAFQGRDVYKDFGFSQFRQQFYDTVVAPVQATYLTFADMRIPV